MAKTTIALSVLLLTAAWLSASAAHALDLTGSGSWSRLFTSDDLQGGAGSDLISTAESGSGQMALTVFNTTGQTDNWRVDVRRADTNWASQTHLWVRRTSDGTGSGTISGGTDYVEVTSLDTQLCTGAGDRTGINLQLKLTGLSVQVNVNTYSTSVTFTVVDLP